MKANRIRYLDGHRGIAILLVIGFHAYVRWPEITPYGDQFSEFPVFQFGYLGVQLFFLISGFVILLTLEKCSSMSDFLVRRWLRLFPAMLICSLLIYFTAGIFSERPTGNPEPRDLIAGLSLIEPYIWLKTTGMDLRNLEGAFWSLYVEFKFYIIAAFFYFTIGSKRLVFGVFFCFLLWWTLHMSDSLHSSKGVSAIYSISNILSFEYFGWFSSGAAYYLYVKTNQSRWFYFGLVVAFISSVATSDFQFSIFIAAFLISLFFSLSIINTKLQSVISNKLLLYFGFISYPLYLLHENMMISITVQLTPFVTHVPPYLYPLLAIGFISVLSFFVSKYIEPSVKLVFVKGSSRLKSFIVPG